MRIIWSSGARKSLEETVMWLRLYSPKAAKTAQDDIQLLVRSAAKFPLLGRAAGQPDIRLRSLPKWKKVVAYRTGKAHIEIVAIIDTRQERAVLLR